jgi:hypothetical protein
MGGHLLCSFIQTDFMNDVKLPLFSLSLQMNNFITESVQK